jgi:hypothetical protein
MTDLDIPTSHTFRIRPDEFMSGSALDIAIKTWPFPFALSFGPGLSLHAHKSIPVFVEVIVLLPAGFWYGDRRQANRILILDIERWQ